VLFSFDVVFFSSYIFILISPILLANTHIEAPLYNINLFQVYMLVSSHAELSFEVNGCFGYCYSH
jgi:hypothetical protein